MSNAITAKIDSIQAKAGISGVEIAQILSTTPETVSRWKVGKVEPQRKRLEHLLLLEWLTQELADLYQPTEARIWLNSPNGMLAGSRPVDLISEGPREMEAVLKVIQQLKDGAFA